MKQKSVLFGAAYYHEYHRAPRLQEDLDLMAAANLTVIRVGESTWSTWEPEEGVFDLEWLRPIVDGAHRRGIKVVVGTPTYAVPLWLARRYPEVAGVRKDGRPIPWGARQEADYTHPAFRFYADRITRKVVSEYRDHPAVIGFQVDNEPGLEFFHGRGVFESFKDWLRARYETVENLNDEWGLTYWSHRLTTWEDLWTPEGNAQPQYDLAWRRFQAHLVDAFIASQMEIVRNLKRDDQFAMTCIAFDRPALDEHSLAGQLDVVAGNVYYAMQDGLAFPRPAEQGPAGWWSNGAGDLLFVADRMYAAGSAPFLVTETNAGSVGRSATNFPAYDGQWRQAAWALVGRGASMVEYWHWHSTHFGTETFWMGILPHDLTPGRAFREIVAIGGEFERAGEAVLNLTPLSDLTVLYSVSSKWAMSFAPPHVDAPVFGQPQFDEGAYRRFFDPFYLGALEAGYQPRIVHDTTIAGPEGDWLVDPAQFAAENPRLLVPALYSATDGLLDWLGEYAQAGGHLVLGPRSAYADEEARARTEMKPAKLSGLAGSGYQEFSNLTFELPVSGSPGLKLGPECAVHTWVDMLTPSSASTVASYSHPHFQNWSAVTDAPSGKGRITLIGGIPNLEFSRELARWLQGVPPVWAAEQPHVTASRSVNGQGREIVVLHNWSWTQADVVAPVAVDDLLSDQSVSRGQTVAVGAWGVRVLAVSE